MAMVKLSRSLWDGRVKIAIFTTNENTGSPTTNSIQGSSPSTLSFLHRPYHLHGTENCLHVLTTLKGMNGMISSKVMPSDHLSLSFTDFSAVLMKNTFAIHWSS